MQLTFTHTPTFNLLRIVTCHTTIVSCRLSIDHAYASTVTREIPINVGHTEIAITYYHFYVIRKARDQVIMPMQSSPLLFLFVTIILDGMKCKDPIPASFFIAIMLNCQSRQK